VVNKKTKAVVVVLLLVGVGFWLVQYLHGTTVAVLDPKGPVAQQERGLMYFALLLSLVVVIPVLGLTAAFAWRYREGNTKAKYSPELDGNLVAETIWWLIPSALILTLSVVAWNSSHQLDPYKPLASTQPAMTIQVVALDWKWLFIYPQQHIATVNFVQFPAHTSVDFQITADAPMNSFWIPQLGGQIYAMPGMDTQLNLEASSYGSFHGLSANISGVGFAGMNFVAKASSQADFDQWVRSVQQSSMMLDQSSYDSLAKPSQNNAMAEYTDSDSGLFDTIINSYMMPSMPATTKPSMSGTSSMPTMNMSGMNMQ
jgi:cytochrome o ubiquinol oxidase subunit 2